MKILLITIITLLTTQWVYENWLSYKTCLWPHPETGEIIHKSYFPNMQTFALTQVGYNITVEQAEAIHVVLERQKALRKVKEATRKNVRSISNI